ncbi:MULTISPECIES: hypothetical protein [Pseudomonas]|uniref:hypothetical protein n=1 Tax=Pseudomonas TaxID=286 RepID=UPI000761C51F|nr:MULTISPECIES: hypothetical protein [Pseudomonas]MDG9809452.1 hypothetical protein [Pseudomonas juntendi]MDG9815809.1 hypothetical protein [Pseudomonas putida]
MNIPGPKEVVNALRLTGQDAFADEFEALLAKSTEQRQRKPVPLPASVNGVKTFGIVPDLVYGRDQFGPTCGGTEEPLYVLLSDHHAQLAERDAMLRDTKLCIERNDYPVFELLKRIDAVLSASAVPSTMVELDEREKFEVAYCEYFNALPGVSTPITPEQMRESRDGDHYEHGSNGKNLRWEGWQMRAGLEVPR